MTEASFTIRTADRALHVENGVITDRLPVGGATIEIPEGQIRPGLINAHDHLHRNHYGRLGNPPYVDAYEWARDVEADFGREIAAGRMFDRRESFLAGAWKNLFAGVTTVVHHDPWAPEFEEGMPLRVVIPSQVHSLGLEPRFERPRGGPFCIHLAEGTGPAMAREVHSLARLGLLNYDLLAVHCIGLDEEAVTLFRASGAAVVWCPSSNGFLFGRTAPARLLAEGVDVLLGTDSLLTGDGDLLDELARARTIGLLSDERLELAVGEVAARRLELPPPSVEPGAATDIVVLSAPLLDASAHDVELVLVGGVPRVAHPRHAPVLEALGFVGKAMTVNGVKRWTYSEKLNRIGSARALTTQSHEPA